MLGEQSRLGGAGALPVQRRVEFEELPRSAVADRGFRFGERAKMERENVGAQENVLRLGKVSKDVESSTKTVVGHRGYRKEHERTGNTLSCKPRAQN